MITHIGQDPSLWRRTKTPHSCHNTLGFYRLPLPGVLLPSDRHQGSVPQRSRSLELECSSAPVVGPCADHTAEHSSGLWGMGRCHPMAARPGCRGAGRAGVGSRVPGMERTSRESRGRNSGEEPAQSARGCRITQQAPCQAVVPMVLALPPCSCSVLVLFL